MRGLLLAISDEPEGREDAFNRWYHQHASARMTIPEITAARRYLALDGRPRYLADYELESLAVLESPAYLALRSNRPPGEQEMLDSLPHPIDRRTYRQLEPGPPMSAPGQAATHTVACWSADEPSADSPGTGGWLQSRRFQLVTGEGAEFLTMHDVASASAAQLLSATIAGPTAQCRAFSITRGYRR